MMTTAFTDPDPLSRQPVPREQQPSTLPPTLVSMLNGCGSQQLRQVQAVVSQILEERARVTPVDLEPVILAAAEAIVNGGKTVGLIPLDRLRLQLPDIPRKTLDEALMDMDKRGTISLKPSQAIRPSRGEAGIQSDRGLLFFVILP